MPKKIIYPSEKVCIICGVMKSILLFRKRKKRGKEYILPRCKLCDNKAKNEKRNPPQNRASKAESDRKLRAEIIRLSTVENYGTRKIHKILGTSRDKIKLVLREAGLNFAGRQNPKKPIPTEKICIKCPEKGLQPISNFKLRNCVNGRKYYRYCL